LDNITSNSIWKEDSIPDNIPIKEEIGKIGLMWPRTYSVNHPASTLLNEYATKGCPVDCGEDWSMDHIIKAILHGPHKSAKNKDAAAALHAETKSKIKNGFAKLVKFKDIKNNCPPKLKISPVACIPHKSKSFRVILDLSFNLKANNITFPSVNETTEKLAPQESMVQLGNCVKRIINTMEKNYNKEIPFKFCKLDIKDGFWRLVVNENDAWNFCYVLPNLNNTKTSLDETEIVVPHSLQMGWCESPPFFCASSETARDTIQNLLNSNITLPQHKFEHKMLPAINQQPTKPQKHTTTLIEVFVDDFIGVTNNTSIENLTSISRAMLHGIHSVFPPNEITQHPGGDSIAENKIDKGEGKWETCKEVLGWNFDGDKYTIQLPPDKCDNIIKLIKTSLKQRVLPLKKFQKIAGKLQHASLGVPGGSGLFSPLQAAMVGNPKYINVDKYLKVALEDWRTIIHFQKTHPISVKQLVANIPNIIGYGDACKQGAGGVLTPGTDPHNYIVWQVEWPTDIQQRLVTDTNPKGDISMNDLELAGIILTFLAVELTTPNIQHKHIGTYCDNTSAVSWANKLRTSKSIPAARLLRMLGLRLMATSASSLTTLNIPGTDNEMADISSRTFKQGAHFAQKISLTKLFNTKFPLPKQNYWTELKIPSKWTSRVMSCVRGEQLTMESLLKLPKPGKNIGNTGQNMSTNGSKTYSSNKQQTYKKESYSQHLLRGSGQASTAADLKSKFLRSKRRLRPSPRPQNWQENTVPFTKMTKHTSCQYKDASRG
jgi:hypothetical protein